MKFLENKTPDFIKTKILILIGMENTSSTQLIMIKVVDKTNKIFEIHFVLATVINIMWESKFKTVNFCTMPLTFYEFICQKVF